MFLHPLAPDFRLACVPRDGGVYFHLIRLKSAFLSSFRASTGRRQSIIPLVPHYLPPNTAGDMMSSDKQLQQAVLPEPDQEPSVVAAHIGITARGTISAAPG
jgi:hypothetical protein